MATILNKDVPPRFLFQVTSSLDMKKLILGVLLFLWSFPLLVLGIGMNKESSAGFWSAEWEHIAEGPWGKKQTDSNEYLCSLAWYYFPASSDPLV